MKYTDKEKGCSFRSISEAKKLSDVISTKNGYYYTAYDYYTPDFKIEDYIDIKEENIGSINKISVSSKEGIYIDFYGISDRIIDMYKANMKEGVWFDAYENDKYIPVVSYGNIRKVGEVFKVKDKSCKVIGLIDKNEPMISLTAGASNGFFKLNRMLKLSMDGMLIVPYKSKKYNCFNKKDIFDSSPQSSSIIFTEDGNDDLELENGLKKYGTITSIEEMISNFEKEKNETLITNVILLIVFIILTIVAVIGINGIQLEQNKKYYSITYILGFSSGKCMLIEAINSASVFVLSYVMFLVVYYLLNSKTSIFDLGEPNVGVSIFVFVYMIGIFFITSFSNVLKSAKRNIMDLYRD